MPRRDATPFRASLLSLVVVVEAAPPVIPLAVFTGLVRRSGVAAHLPAICPAGELVVGVELPALVNDAVLNTSIDALFLARKLDLRDYRALQT